MFGTHYVRYTVVASWAWGIIPVILVSSSPWDVGVESVMHVVPGATVSVQSNSQEMTENKLKHIL